MLFVRLSFPRLDKTILTSVSKTFLLKTSILEVDAVFTNNNLDFFLFHSCFTVLFMVDFFFIKKIFG